MEELSLRVENVSKEYRLGTIGGNTLKNEIQSKFAKLRHKEDPNLKIGEKAHEKNERFVALDSVSFEVKKGERIGIIGHNGAGKSTLLKLICRVTAPSTGNIYINGRITSMLEVGTGFHNELTGRENIYLNGAILGMSKEEIDEKYDEIVAFSEIGQFIDTPIKRYSSGMKVKLGFSVASHLNSEIMIMDEVLAVGDVNFQNKCIEKMKSVANEEHKTIFYVSHNMATVRNLCDRCIVLSHGKIVYDGNTEKAISIYMGSDIHGEDTVYDFSEEKRPAKYNLHNKILNVELMGGTGNHYLYGDKIRFRMTWEGFHPEEELQFKILIYGMGVMFGGKLDNTIGIHQKDFEIDTSFFSPMQYTLCIRLYGESKNGNVTNYDEAQGVFVNIDHGEKSVHLKQWASDWGGAVLPCLSVYSEEDR